MTLQKPACDFGYYGNSCDISCGHCVNYKTCDSDTGHCPGGCQTGWQRPLCKTLCKTRQQVQYSLTEILVICGIVGCILLLIVAFSVFCYVRYKKKKKCKEISPLRVTGKDEVPNSVSAYISTYEQITEDVNNTERNKYNQVQAYEALLKESASIAMEIFPNVYKELLTVLNDGKTPLYYAFQSLRRAEPHYESIVEEPDENVDVTSMSYKDLVSRYQSLPRNYTASLKEGTAKFLQIQELRFVVSNMSFLTGAFWATLNKHNVSTCIQIGENNMKKDEKISVGNYIIECTSRDKETSVTNLTVTLNCLVTGFPASVRIMACGFWEECMEVPVDILSLIDLINRLSTTAEKDACILIHCQHDIRKAVLFVVLFAILTKMKKDRVVDILSPTVTVRRGVTHAISTYVNMFYQRKSITLQKRNSSNLYTTLFCWRYKGTEFRDYNDSKPDSVGRGPV